MNRKQKNRLLIICISLCVLGFAASLVLYALKQNINLFYTPSQLIAANLATPKTVRLGGYVQKHSVRYDANGSRVYFNVSDAVQTLHVQYQGVLPSLFREGQGVVMTGSLQGELFTATEVLAKHDENYMPPILVKALNTPTGNKPS